ncbi:16S rRNA (uracil(1498)-N(3))-methyltransferase [Saccharothrix coeruleofusca]|uniref:Ribosomal RNA small subunit methyltransferase E n=1 Tax=Saccharothrix coeruleofusca TaxID=33919 RepID=A0A918AIV7_9PSEU|nr:16S rRNA (uracil(1498)-N(3))-methyltransferase [Saccharothrix coeruleofusca]MBP2334260.1 16S rRNA (uracil1498-N3)-methyltransferase [Saccharothrix coeruleofusca]GGP42309.1 ribosomal RNA small subunit methyltransferase E [Saccharothrix coeruleofusca]
MTLPVFLVDALPAGPHAVLDGPEGRHAATVRRLRAGEELVLSDGSGEQVRCVVDEALKDSLRLRVLQRWTAPEPAVRVVLAQALVKGDRGELAVELATEAGVDAVLPWRAARCVAKWEEGPRGAKALARWRATAREAAKQARRARVPSVGEPVTTRDLARLAASSAAALVLHESAKVGIGSIGLPPSGDVLIVVGPEGGITDQELAELVEAGARAVRLGPTVLRASTAGAVALGALGVLTDRWA